MYKIDGVLKMDLSFGIYYLEFNIAMMPFGESTVRQSDICRAKLICYFVNGSLKAM